MVNSFLRLLLILLNAIKFIFLTLLLYILSYLPLQKFGIRFQPLFRYWSTVFARALGVDIRLHQHNREHQPEHFIMIANHPSAFEDIGLPALFDVISLAKIEVADWWVLGRISTAAGTLYVNRESKISRGKAQQNIIDAVNAGRNVALYPEGGCKDKRIAERFYIGAFEASCKTGKPIIPVLIHYEAQDDFFWRPNVPVVKKMWEILNARNPTANFHVFDAFKPEDFPDREAFRQAVYQQYRKWQKKYLD